MTCLQVLHTHCMTHICAYAFDTRRSGAGLHASLEQAFTFVNRLVQACMAAHGHRSCARDALFIQQHMFFCAVLLLYV